MMKKLIVVAAAILILAAVPAFGQHPANIGIDVGWANLDKDVTGANAWQLGFRAGYFALSWLEIEGQVAGARASEDVGSVNLDTTLLAGLVNGVFSYPSRKISPYALIGVGGANLQVTPGISSFSDFAVAWQLAAGARFFVAKSVALRAEVGHLREKTFDAWNGHWRVTGGIVWSFGER